MAKEITMKRNIILLTVIGNNDCYLFEGKPGAIVNIVDEIDLDKLYILYNHKRYIPHASKILLYYRKKKPNLEVKYQAAECVNPTDYNLVYPAMFQAIKRFKNKRRMLNTLFLLPQVLPLCMRVGCFSGRVVF